MRVRDLGSRPAPNAIRELFSRMVRGHAPAIFVRRREIPYWQERGWTNDARINTTSIIYYPQAGAQVSGSLPIAGVAFAGDRGISKVEVSTDGGSTWNTAELKLPKSPYSWVLWAYDWTPTTNGTQTIIVRATDGSGQAQDSTNSQPFPNGATGYNSIEVSVT